MTDERLKIYMAPMQGYTDAPFRNSFEKRFGGVEAYYTPFVRWEREGVRRKDMRDLNPEANRVTRLVPQIMAGSADEADAVLGQIGGWGYKEFDLNMGCAFPVVAKKGKGCGILPYPERVEDLLRIAERHPELSFSVKMRLGYDDPSECMALLPVLNQARLSGIVVHARTGRQQYKGDCDREAFGRFARECVHPVVYNGGVSTLDELDALRGEMPYLDGVMIGRGLLASPWLAAEYRCGTGWDQERRMSALRGLHGDLLDHYARTLEGGEKQLLTRMKTFWEYLCPDADRKARKKILKARNVPEYTQAVFRLLQEM